MEAGYTKIYWETPCTPAGWFYMLAGRGLHSSTFRLDVSTLCGYIVWSHTVSVTKTAQVELRSGQCEPLLAGSPLMFVTFSDTCVYWIHRALHHRWGWWDNLNSVSGLVSKIW